ncbi:MAG: formimidoylglutamate deiminase [Bacteroidota bacterium]
MLSTFKLKGLLHNEKWLMPAYVELDEQGKIVSISEQAEENKHYEEINGFAIPGLQNAHSHAFQYAMVGLTEQHDTTGKRDDFWGWRKAMYQLALSVSPEQMEVIAAMLYSELLRHGYTSVAEFHYVHHDKNGQAYQNPSELGERLIAAAKKVGIKITLIPIFYQKGGFGKAAGEEQRRFISKDKDAYLQLLDASRESYKYYENANLAYGVHSMRAVEPNIIKQLKLQMPKAMPFHIHVSEQLKEVQDSIDYLGKRPVEWLSENIDLDENCHLVHATHLTNQEVEAIAQSRANVVLCPSTEGNLGDGLFSLDHFQQNTGNWSIGTDSHIGLNPFEELRILDYGQRVTTHQRDTFCTDNQGNSGLSALNQVIKNGRKAMGNSTNTFFEVGESFDALVLDADAPILQVCSPENMASTIVYASDVSMHLGTIVNGEWKIKNGKHEQSEEIKRSFIKTLNALGNR